MRHLDGLEDVGPPVGRTKEHNQSNNQKDGAIGENEKKAEELMMVTLDITSMLCVSEYLISMSVAISFEEARQKSVRCLLK